MGITGLLPFIKNACRPANIRDFQGSAVAIDAYSWLHKGVFSCAEKIVKGEKTDGYIYYCMKQLNMLLDAGVKPIMVFDGCNLESKAVTEKKRRENREKTKQRGKEYLCEGKIKEARECFQRCVDVTPEMAMEVIQACRKKKIDCIVAPYEADAQLAYLSKMNLVQVVITEDSDLVLFGCEKILFKMDSFGGGLLYEKQNLSKAFGNAAEKMSFEKFRYMCILSGCDYLPSLPGIGLAKAFKFFTLTNNPDLQSILSKVPNYLRMSSLVVTAEYKNAFLKANNTFLYQVVFCPRARCLVPLNSYPENVDSSEMEYAGKYFNDELAFQLAIGNISVKKLKELESSNRGISGIEFDPELTLNTNGLWGDAITSTNIPAPSTKSFFKVKQSSPNKHSPSINKKRTFDQMHKDASHSRQDKILFSAYCSTTVSQVKKQRVEDTQADAIQNLEVEESTEKKSPTSVFVPFKKTLTSNSSNVCKSLSDLPFKKIVRSRFFVTEEVKIQETKLKETSCLDTIDDEYRSSLIKQPPVCDNSSLPEPKNERDSGICVDDDIDDLLVIDESEIDEKENVTVNFNESSVFKFKSSFNHAKTSHDSLVLNDELNSSSESVDHQLTSLPNSEHCNSSVSNNINVSTRSVNSCENTGELSKPLTDLSEDIQNQKCNDKDKIDSSQSSELDSSQCSSLGSSQKENSLAKFFFQPLKPSKKKGTATRCRTVGLSKKHQPNSQNQKNIIDTLFNFKFTRSPQITLT